MRKFSIYLFFLILITACKEESKNENFSKIIKAKPYAALMFMAPDCPLCVTLSQPYNELASKYPDVQFLAVHSGKNYDAMEINMFATETKFLPPIFAFSIARHAPLSIPYPAKTT